MINTGHYHEYDVKLLTIKLLGACDHEKGMHRCS
jgi:hypothetical protein